VEDITERKKTEEALRLEKKRLGDILDSMADGVTIIDMNGRILDINNATTAQHGYTKEEVLGRRPGELFMPESEMPKFLETVKDLQSGKEVINREFLARRKDGRTFPALISCSVIMGTEGRPAAAVVVHRDITERKRAEETLRASEARYKSHIELTEQLAWTTNAAGGVEEDIPLWRKFTGQSYDEVKGDRWTSALHPDDAERAFLVWKKAVETKSHYETEYRVRRHDGVYRHILARGVPVLKEDGSIREWVGTCIDITERKKTEEALQKAQEELEKKIEERTAALKLSTEQLRMATEGTGIGTWHWNIVSGELLWSDKCKAIFGVPQNEVMSYQRFLQALHPDDRERTDKAVHDALNNHKEYIIDYRGVWPDGSIHWITARGLGYYDAAGKAVRMEGMVLDITERKTVEEELRRKYEELERFRKATVDREFRMQELQEEIARLKEGKK
jgi:PAS domain S-box-containing protein